MENAISELRKEVAALRADVRQGNLNAAASANPPHESVLSNIFKHHFSWILTLLLATGGYLWQVSQWKSQTEHMQSDFNLLKQEVLQSNTHGSEYAREQVQSLKAVLEFHEKRLSILETDGRITTVTLNELKSDLRAVRDWVDDQKKKEPIK